MAPRARSGGREGHQVSLTKKGRSRWERPFFSSGRAMVAGVGPKNRGRQRVQAPFRSTIFTKGLVTRSQRWPSPKRRARSSDRRQQILSG